MLINVFDHLATIQKRLHIIEQIELAVETADAHGTEHLMARKREKIAIKLLYINRLMRHKLSAINQDDRTESMSRINNTLEGRDKTRGV